MHTLFKGLIISLAIPFTSAAFALNTSQAALFEVVQTQIIFDKSTVQTANITTPRDVNDSYGVNLKLTPFGTNTIGEITKNNPGKKANLILNNQILSSATIKGKLGNKILFPGLTKDQAIKFIQVIGLKGPA